MGFFGLMFWFLAVFLFVTAMRRRCDRRGATPAGGPELDEQWSHLEALESRVVQLEERLDFTERLLASRAEPAPRA